MPYTPTSTQLIEKHGIIGNMRTAAIITAEGTIDFFCFPAFDSPSVFAALLDSAKGGLFSIQPDIEGVRFKQMYLPDTNILLTRFLSDTGVAELTDFMPIDDTMKPTAYANQIIRMVRVVKGTIRFTMRCAPRFDYARAQHSVCKEGDSICFYPEGGEVKNLALHGTVPMDVDGADAVAEFTLSHGETASFALGQVKREETGPQAILDSGRMQHSFDETVMYWREWVGKSVYKGRWREVVNRSALVLKLLSSQEHGATIAAATFGLPESLGGSRNWDYRYSWLRDSSFVLYALVRLGLSSEVRAFADWMRERVTEGLGMESPDGPLRIMYRIDGSTDLEEETLDHLAGYKNSRPVRIGNGANQQLQLDIYGELMDAFYLSNKYSDGVSKDGWRRAMKIMEWLGQNWNRPDEGIWEMRGGRRNLLHSRLMCWVAFDRVIRLAGKRSLEAPLAEWYETRRQINEDILNNFWDEELQSFVQVQGEKAVDASMLLMPMLRFISPMDPRWQSTLARIEDSLSEDSLVFRYPPGSDDLDGEEGSFTACSFWLIECLARGGQVDKARLLFDKMLGYANHLGLYSEQLGRSGEHLGNFPQALTHLALISAATYLDRKLDGNTETWA